MDSAVSSWESSDLDRPCNSRHTNDAGEWWEAGLAVASLFSVLMGALMLLPNEFMPDYVRLAHFAELSLSNFVFGWVVVWLLTFNRASSATLRAPRV